MKQKLFSQRIDDAVQIQPVLACEKNSGILSYAHVVPSVALTTRPGLFLQIHSLILSCFPSVLMGVDPYTLAIIQKMLSWFDQLKAVVTD